MSSDDTKRDVAIPDDLSGLAVTDAQGNRVWKFLTKSGKFLRDSTTRIRSLMASDELALEEPGASERQPDGELRLEESVDGDPYNSGGSR